MVRNMIQLTVPQYLAEQLRSPPILGLLEMTNIMMVMISGTLGLTTLSGKSTFITVFVVLHFQIQGLANVKPALQTRQVLCLLPPDGSVDSLEGRAKRKAKVSKSFEVHVLLHLV
jgi:hypothetical protein